MAASIAWRYLTATCYALFEQIRNQTALILLIAFVPTWDYFFWLIVPNAPIDFRFRATNVFLHVKGNPLGLLTHLAGVASWLCASWPRCFCMEDAYTEYAYVANN